LAASVAALADQWWDEDSGIEHVAACQDYGCKDCVVIACATDLRALLAEWRFPPGKHDGEGGV
jgi:hypothetical protein